LSYIRSRAHRLGLTRDFLPHSRSARARARRRNSKGRTVGRHHHCHRDCQRAEQDSGAAGSCHDRRNHAARQSVAHRRTEGKLLAAHRAGLFEVILPRTMKKISPRFRKLTQCHEAAFRDTMDQVLQIALESPLQALSEEETTRPIAPLTSSTGDSPAAHQ